MQDGYYNTAAVTPSDSCGFLSSASNHSCMTEQIWIVMLSVPCPTCRLQKALHWYNNTEGWVLALEKEMWVAAAFWLLLQCQKKTCAPTTVIEVLHPEAARIFNEGLDFLVSLHRLIAGVVNMHHIWHKTARKKTGQKSRIEEIKNAVTSLSHTGFRNVPTLSVLYSDCFISFKHIIYSLKLVVPHLLTASQTLYPSSL